MSSIIIIDRFEEKWAVVECKGNTFNIPRDLLPTDAKEGDAIDFTCSINESTTRERKNHIKKLEDQLFK